MSLVAEQSIEWVQGDDNVMDLLVTDPVTGLPVNLGNGKVWVVAKRWLRDADADATVLVDSDGNGVVIDADPATGRAVATIPRAALAGLVAPTWLYYSVQARVDQPGGQRTWEVVRGIVTVTPGLLSAV